MELLWERMLAFYLELMMLIVPDEKRGVRQRRLAKGFAVCTALLCIGLVLGGAFLLAALDSASRKNAEGEGIEGKAVSFLYGP